ncbi:unnamed protein product [Larinioides sclopetarius]|uniref:Uncharacterized protein n=2 Tax=Larinioides sclopetarius TaxID=280406 RepID=A0AAV2C1G8_9ARAC
MVYGIIAIILTISITNVDSIAQATIVFLSVAEGPVLAVFLVGVLTRKSSDKCTVISMIVSVVFISWICFGSLFCGYVYPSLPLDTSECPNKNSTTLFGNSTTSCINDSNCVLIEPSEFYGRKTKRRKRSVVVLGREPFLLYKVAYSWIPTLGCIITITFIFIGSILTSWNKSVILPDSKCLSPVVRLRRKGYDDSDTQCHIDGISLECENKLELTKLKDDNLTRHVQ